MQGRVRHPRETMRDGGELRARAASVKANPTPVSRPYYNNNILATTSLLPTTPLIDIDRYTLLNKLIYNRTHSIFAIRTLQSHIKPQPSPDRVPSRRYRNSAD
jgi:hypothetical protein